MKPFKVMLVVDITLFAIGIILILKYLEIDTNPFGIASCPFDYPALQEKTRCQYEDCRKRGLTRKQCREEYQAKKSLSMGPVTGEAIRKKYNLIKEE